METKAENRLVEVFSGNVWESEILKSFLESAGIQVFLKNEIIGSVYPVVSSGGIDPVIVMVLSSDLDTAKEIVKEYKKGYPKS